jgi:hypothetical protein
LGITVKLEITSQAILGKQILFLGVWRKLFCADSELNLFHMGRMVKIEAEISASVCGFSIDFDGVSFLITRTSREGTALSESIS